MRQTAFAQKRAAARHFSHINISSRKMVLLKGIHLRLKATVDEMLT